MNELNKPSSGIIRTLTGIGGALLAITFFIFLIDGYQYILKDQENVAYWIVHIIIWTIAIILSIFVTLLGLWKKCEYRTISKFAFGFASLEGIVMIISVYCINNPLMKAYMPAMPFIMLATFSCLITFALLLIPNKKKDILLDSCIGIAIPVSLLFVIIDLTFQWTLDNQLSPDNPLNIASFIFQITGLVILLLSSIWGLVKNYNLNKEGNN